MCIQVCTVNPPPLYLPQFSSTNNTRTSTNEYPVNLPYILQTNCGRLTRFHCINEAGDEGNTNVISYEPSMYKTAVVAQGGSASSEVSTYFLISIFSNGLPYTAHVTLVCVFV